MALDAVDARYNTVNTISGRRYNVVEDLISANVVVAAAPEDIFAQSSNRDLILDRSSLYGALTRLPSNCSPWERPNDWLLVNRDHVVTALRGSRDLQNELTCILSKPILLYQRLIVCTVIELLIRSDTRLLVELRGTLRIWQAYDDLTSLLNHQQMKDYLHKLIQDQLQLLSDPYIAPVLRQVLHLDVIAICVRLSTMLKDPKKCGELHSLRNTKARDMLLLLQSHLDYPPLHPLLRRTLVAAAIKLSRKSGCYPECLVRSDIQKVGPNPQAVGRFGDVWKGRMQGRDVAVKILRVYVLTDMIQFLKECSTEAVTWRQLWHPNVLPFYGVFHLNMDRTRVCLISPWMENGNIVQYLEQNSGINCIRLVLDIALGLEYLHIAKPTVIHGDLKGLNILVTRSGRACLADFGLSSVKDSQGIGMSSDGRTTGTSRWQAPELLMPGDEDNEICNRNTVQSDVYAFACVCYEIFSGEYPFKEIKNDNRVVIKVVNGQRPSRPLHELCRTRGLDDTMWNLVQRCWSQCQEDRPSASDIVEQLRSVSPEHVDDRPSDDFDHSFWSKILSSHAEYPFNL